MSGQLAASEAAEIETPIWQLPTLPRVPEYWRATPTEQRPALGKPVSSMIQASGAIASCMRSARRSRTGCHSQGLWLTN